jgi:multicomponent Na+:H+ antiporter subunit D
MVALVTLATAWVLLQEVLTNGVIRYSTLPYALRSVEKEIDEKNIAYFYALLMLCFAGLLGMTVTGDVFNLFVFLEISSLSMYSLIALGRDRRALTASFQYLVMGTIGGTFVLIGVGFLYVITGTLNMADLAQLLPDVTQTRTLHTAFAFIVVGIGLKLAVFPLHLWLPNAYAYAPSTATVFIAATATKVAVYALLRFIFSIFGADTAYGDLPLGEILMVLAVLGILIASTVAIFQENIKRMLAYSSVAQIGYIVLGICLASSLGLTASILHLFNHALMKGALFMAMGCFYYRLGSVQLDDLSGIARQMPWTFSAFVIAGLSLIGVPLTVGFISKWYLVGAALEEDGWLLALLVLAGSLLAVIYIWRVVEAAWFGKPSAKASDAREAPLPMLAATWLLVIANLYFGANTTLTAGIATRAAEALIGGLQ